MAFSLSILPAVGLALSAGAGPLTFEADILPILREHCFPCHSTGKRKHGLDVRQARLLVRGGDSGPAIVPGKPGESKLLSRIERGEMPPGERMKLSGDAIGRIRRWIEEGAQAGEEAPIPEPAGEEFVTPDDRQHWAFRPMERPAVPLFESTDRVRNPIDAFILEKLRASGLGFAPDAAMPALVRRVFFDLTGLPPSPAELEEVLLDPLPDAHERLVDRLLASPHHGERWARHWLDAAGYADSDGYSDADTERPDAWRYRDYVIRSLNADKPFDQFLTEQLAGDELAGYPGSPPGPREVELLAATGFLRSAADGTAQPGVDAVRARHQVIADTVSILGTGVLGLTLGCAQCHDHRYDPISQRDYHRIRAALEPAYDTEAWKPPPARRISLYTEEERRKAGEVAREVEGKRAERNATEAQLVRAVVDRLIAEKIPGPQRDAALAAFLAGEKRTPEQAALLESHPFLKNSGGTLSQYDKPAADRVKALDADIARIASTRPVEDFVSALWEEPGRIPPSRLLVRGQPDQPAEAVEPGVPAVLVPPGESTSLGRDGDGTRTSGRRLRLARWLTRPDHPLTARVAANRIWMHHFGRGIVPTPGDFGKQGDPPTHPELLDWLSTELVRGGWKMKRIHRLIVTSTAYRQAAVATKKALEEDPENRLHSRRSITRLEGEAVRDAILAVSGALDRKQGGPPVPVREDEDGSIVVGVDKKGDSNQPGPEVPIGTDAWRRSIYIQVRRSRPLSFTAAFDVPVPETNCTRRTPSVTAPQALTLLNGRFAREQAEVFAARLEKEAPDDAARVDLAFRLAFGRPPSAGERDEASRFLMEQAGILSTRPVKAGEAAATPAHTALVHFCHVIWNTSELIFIE